MGVKWFHAGCARGHSDILTSPGSGDEGQSAVGSEGMPENRGRKEPRAERVRPAKQEAAPEAGVTPVWWPWHRFQRRGREPRAAAHMAWAGPRTRDGRDGARLDDDEAASGPWQ